MATYRNGKLISHKTLPSRRPTVKTEEAVAAAARRAAPLPVASPCVHLGGYTGQTYDCGTCGGGKAVPVRRCALHGECTYDRNLQAKVDGAVRQFPWCVTCRDHQPLIPAPTRQRIDRLPTGPDNWGFNSSLIRWRGQLLLAYRTGWRGSQIRVARMTEELQLLDSVPLSLASTRSNYGCEDPRFFVHQDRLHLSFIGVRGREVLQDTHQLYAVLDDDLRVKRIYYPHYARRRGWEKNWQFFSLDSQLFAVYDIVPHTVLRVDGDRATEVSRIDWSQRWSGGMLRGGASPVLVGDEYWCFFHGKIQPRYNYSVGVYCFEAKPPFRPTRYTPDPVYWADRKTKPKDQYCPVVFPCGAVHEGGTWLVSCGIHDRWTEILTFVHADIERAMVAV